MSLKRISVGACVENFGFFGLERNVNFRGRDQRQRERFLARDSDSNTSKYVQFVLTFTCVRI